MTETMGWVGQSRQLDGPGFAQFQLGLTKYNARQLTPSFPDGHWQQHLREEASVSEAESEAIEAQREAIAPLIADVPEEVEAFIAWFEALKENGPGQGDPLFPWLAEEASLAQMRWFLTQEVAGEAGFDDLLAITQVKMPETAKLEMARNYWDEMGRGKGKAMHGPLLEKLAAYLNLEPVPEAIIPESLALGNAMVTLARHRRYAFQSVGALGVIEMTAPTRAGHVNLGLKRLGIPTKQRHYFALHSILDVKHSEAWNREVLHSLVAEDGRRARAIAEGAVLRLWHGARCFEKYREHFGLATPSSQAA